MTKLSEIQQKLKAPKNQRAQNNRYTYRSCEDILEAVKPLLGDAELIVSDEILLIGDRYYVKATATLHDGDKQWSATAYAREGEPSRGMDPSQTTGAASSYARKYALNGLFCIDDTKDADATNSHGKPAVSKEATAQLSEACKRYAEAAGQDLAAIKKAIWEELRGKDEAAFKLKTQQLHDWVEQNGGN